MNALVIAFMSVLFFTNMLENSVHKYFALLAEAISGVILVLVLLKGATARSVAINPKYLILGLFVALCIVAGLVLNAVNIGTFVAGGRPYLKWIPLFLLPAVYRFSENELRLQLKTILSLALLQAPVASYQFFIEYWNVATGDVITGTLGPGASGTLSILMLSVIAGLVTMYIRAYIRLSSLVLLSIFLFIPCTLNETKITIVLLPIAVMTPFLFAPTSRFSPLQLTVAGALLAVFIGGFVSIYDYTYGAGGRYDHNSKRRSIADFFVGQAENPSYLYKGKEFDAKAILAKQQRIGALVSATDVFKRRDEGRVGEMLLPLRVLSEEPVLLAVGLGMGNTSASFLERFEGDYAGVLSEVSGSSLISLVLWETGVIGTILFLLFLYLVFQDSRKVATKDDLVGAIAQSWVAVLMIIALITFYINYFIVDVLIYFVAYFSGFVAAEKYRCQLE